MAQHILKINVVLNLSQVINVDRFQKKNRPTLVSTAADRYFRYLRNRFISNSSRNSSWPSLKQETIERKERRGITDNPHWKLREYDIMLNAIGIRVIGGVTYVGFVRDRKHPRGKTVLQLVRMHSTGEGKLPVREAIGLPSSATLKKMAQDVRDQYNRVIRKNRR